MNHERAGLRPHHLMPLALLAVGACCIIASLFTGNGLTGSLGLVALGVAAMISCTNLRQASVAAASLVILGAVLTVSGSAHAQQFGRIANSVSLGMTQCTASSTFATTSYADLPGCTYTFIPVVDPARTEAPGGTVPSVLLRVQWSLDVTKATTTTGTCGLYANGALIAASARTIDVAAKEGTMSGDYEVALTSGASQTVKLQCKSGDTAALTVNLGQMRASYVY